MDLKMHSKLRLSTDHFYITTFKIIAQRMNKNNSSFLMVSVNLTLLTLKLLMLPKWKI